MGTIYEGARQAALQEFNMPLPIGHTALGLAVIETVPPSQTQSSRLSQLILITLLANLPDVDVLVGLIVQGNGAAYHRGPTHSLVFALLAGYAASHLWRVWNRIPKYPFTLCSLLIFSHVVADMLLTSAPVSLFWPLEIHWSYGHNGWGQVFDMVISQSIHDAGIVLIVLAYVLALRIMRGTIAGLSLFALAKKRVK
jgi:membrane-bound metal-dependent hydrolase YbcI (DUF457 family)